MGFYETNSRVGPDGKLLVALPLELANTDVHITVEPANVTNGVAAPRAPKTKEEWRRIVEATAGSIPDFPDVERPGPDAYETRDW